MWNPESGPNAHDLFVRFSGNIASINRAVTNIVREMSSEMSVIEVIIKRKMRKKIMPLLPRLSSLWRNLIRKTRAEQELREEVDAYLEMLIEMKIEQGINPAEARRQALIEMGGVEQVKERVREVRMGRHLETLLQDLRYAARSLRKHAL
jgi:hypothetical protein